MGRYEKAMINFSVKIDKGVPYPFIHSGVRRDVRTALDTMKDGDSIFIPTEVANVKKIRQWLREWKDQARRNGTPLYVYASVRGEEAGTRVWKFTTEKR